MSSSPVVPSAPPEGVDPKPLDPGSNEPGFCCPRCTVQLTLANPQRLVCSRCSRVYPRLGGVWCLAPEPALWRALWKSRLDDYDKAAQHQIEQLAAQGTGRDVASPATLQRIDRIRSGLTLQRAALSEHLSVLDDGAQRVPFPSPALSGAAPVLKCYENLFRDWGWGDAEAEQSLQLVRRLAPEQLGRLAVYGAGAARLAVDVHTALSPRSTLAFDINPLPLLVAARLIRGEAVTLPEFPVGPNSHDDVVVTRELRCRTPVSDTFTLAFADSLCPPFGPESIDTVLTSWVIDALDADLQDTARAIANVLRPGGIWLNIGPLRFDRSLRGAYSIEEVHPIVVGAGFEIGASFRESVDYFKSPHSGSSRRETVFCFSARKVARVPLLRAFGVYPEWLSDPDQPIPLGPSTVSFRRSSVFTNGVLSLIDGRRTLRDVAAQLGASWKLPPEALIDPLRAFLARFPME